MKPHVSTRLAVGLLAGLMLASFPAIAAKRMAETLKRPTGAAIADVTASEPLVQLAILLDTSGSMKGLADQARCQLWNAVSRLSTAQRNEKPIRLEIAVYQYGTEAISKSNGCLRQIIPFTEDLDKVSQALFQLKIAGGDEYCGSAINAATTELVWQSGPSVYRTIVIAGNESFFQGETTLGEVLPELRSNDIVLNSIYCGTKYKDDDGWKSATAIAGGSFAKIDHNHHLPDIETPFDPIMRELNREMNDTFVWYGKHSHSAADNQKHQDENSAKLSDHAFAARMSAKIGHLYHHVDHDLVDAVLRGKVKLEKMPDKLMPETLRAMPMEERIAYLDQKVQQRQSVRRRMADVIAQRHSFLQQHLKNEAGGTAPGVFGEALIQALVEQATSRGFEFAEKMVSIE